MAHVVTLVQAGAGAASETTAAAGDLLSLTVLAVVQGLSEFLPISSSGHLVLGQALLGFQFEGVVVEVALHLGTLLAVLWVYRRDLVELVRNVFTGPRRELLQLVVASIPTGIVGVFLGDALEGVFQAPRLAAAGLFFTALVLGVGEWRRRQVLRTAAVQPPEGNVELTWRQVAVIGVAQALAIWPGVSRSGSTIAAGLLAGAPARAAARFSFLLSIPAIGGASLLKLPDAFEAGVPGGPGPLLFAIAVSAVVGLVALRLLLALLGKGAFGGFAIYCAVVGVAALSLLP